MVYQAAEDLRFDKTLKTIRKELDSAGGQFVFDPDDFKDAAAAFEVESHRLPEEGLLEYARLATQLRRQFAQKAEMAKAQLNRSAAQGEEEKNFVVPVLGRAYDKRVRAKKPDDLMLGFEGKSMGTPRKKRHKSKLSCDELKEILRLVREEGITQREVAQLFGVKPTSVMSLIRNEKLNKSTVSQLEHGQTVKKERRGKIVACVDEHVSGYWNIWTT